MSLKQIGARPLDSNNPSDRANTHAGFTGAVPIVMDVHGGKANKYQPHIGAKEQAKWTARSSH